MPVEENPKQSEVPTPEAAGKEQSQKPLRLLSVVIPARDEEGCIASTVEHLHVELKLRGVPHEIIVVDDGSTDRTWEILTNLNQQFAINNDQSTPKHRGFSSASILKPVKDRISEVSPDSEDCTPGFERSRPPESRETKLTKNQEPSTKNSEVLKERASTLVPVKNQGLNGFGRAIQCGLKAMTGDAVVIMMADESDDCRDVVLYWEKLNEGYDCVFGSRFMKGGGVIDYPWLKLQINRIANHFIQVLFAIKLNDTTNAFKAYRKTVIDGVRPILSPHFNITVELPLKAIVRGYSWTTIPITWRNRRTGVAKLKIKEMGSRYLFICLYVWLEKYFSRGDYKKE